MAYKRYYKKRHYARKGKHTLKAVEKKVNKLAKDLKPEMKISDSSAYDFATYWPDITNTGQYIGQAIPDIGLNTGTSYFNKRIGDKIVIRKIRLHGFVRTQDIDTHVIRILMVRWKSTSAANIGSIISTPTQQQAVNSALNSVYDQQFTVLFDKRLTLTPDSGAIKTFSFTKTGRWPVNFVGDSTAVADGEIACYIFSNYASSGSFAPLTTWTVRSEYTDV